MRIPKKTRVAVLKRTRELLARKHGWAKGTFDRPAKDRHHRYVYENGNKDGNENIMRAYCIAGAAKQATREIDPERFANMAEAEIVRELSIEALAAARLQDFPVLAKRFADDPSMYSATFLFNDASKTRQKDVVALLDEKLEEVA
jgi:hypothetical protein